MSFAPGARLGAYESVSRIGAGGMGEVWKARDTRLDRSVAIKVLPVEFSADPQLRVRFEREARTISQLSHPNICTLFDVGDNYMVMELIEGETLAGCLTRGAAPVERRPWLWPAGRGSARTSRTGLESSTAISSQATSC